MARELVEMRMVNIPYFLQAFWYIYIYHIVSQLLQIAYQIAYIYIDMYSKATNNNLKIVVFTLNQLVMYDYPWLSTQLSIFNRNKKLFILKMQKKSRRKNMLKVIDRFEPLTSCWRSSVTIEPANISLNLHNNSRVLGWL